MTTSPTSVPTCQVSNVPDMSTPPKSPITVQQWVNKLPEEVIQPAPQKSLYTAMNTAGRYLVRDLSVQSDGSHCSSIESVLDSRKSDPEEVLISLGFGPADAINPVPRIPQRFLQPSKLLSQIDVNKFLEEQGQSRRYDSRFHSHPASPSRMRSNYL